jgi:Tol biopolymer transport system component
MKTLISRRNPILTLLVCAKSRPRGTKPRPRGIMGIYGRGAVLGVFVLALAACAGVSPTAALPPPTLQPVVVPSSTDFADQGTKLVPSEASLAQATSVVNDNEYPFPTWAQVAFASDRAGDGDIFVTTAEGKLVNLTHHPAGDWDPAWSPACADPTRTCRIAFTSHRSGDSEIWTMDAQGRNLRNITQDPAWDYWPAWSPDGQTLVFVSERDGDPELFVQRIDGEEAIQLTFNNESDRLPAWSPDGSRIAFAAVRNGVEEIHVINAECGSLPAGCDRHERPVTAWPLKGTAPAWSPDGRRIAFIGWDEEDRPGIYIAGPEPETVQELWKGDAWIGSLTWATDPASGGAEGWLLFTSWQDGNHEIYALPVAGGTPVRLTQNPAWDDFPTVRPGSLAAPAAGASEPRQTASEAPGCSEWEQDGPLTPATIEPPGPMPPPRLTPHAGEPTRDSFVFGVNIADLGKAYLVRDLGFGWAKSYVNWETVEPQPGQYNWVDPDNIVTAFEGYGVRILMRVHGTPAWARPEGTFLSHPPDDISDFARFMQTLAARYKGRVAAYEIWNEPNLNYEWGYLEPDPAGYTALLKAAYQAVKVVDPDAFVISGGLATTGDGSSTAMGDLAFLQAMYDAGARGYFDALGSHPYAFGHDPDYEDPWGLSLARVVQQRQVMVTNGDVETPIWITEAGWVLHTNWNLVEHEAIAVDEAQQAAYLVRAYQKVQAEWPWAQALFLFNLDFSSVPWYPAAEPMRWYAILNPDRTPRPAYTHIKYQMTNGK